MFFSHREPGFIAVSASGEDLSSSSIEDDPSSSSSSSSLARPALHGDWPWHAALHRDGQHVCDGALVAREWIMTTKSCFQG